MEEQGTIASIRLDGDLATSVIAVTDGHQF